MLVVIIGCICLLVGMIAGYLIAAPIEFAAGVRFGRSRYGCEPLPETCPPCEPEPCGYLDVMSSEGISVPEKKTTKLKLEALTVCVGYADFLAWTLPFNKAHFDRLIIVTSPEDEATQRLCEFWHVECVVTDAFYSEGHVFNKGRGINAGLKKLSLDDWVLHLDADIFLFPRTREVLGLVDLDPESLYGIDRVNCYGFADWTAFVCDPEPLHPSTGFSALNRFENGARLLNLDRDGYVPIGYFQLWNPSGSAVDTYPVGCDGADRSDALFGYNWERRNRHIIPELACVHIESVGQRPELGINWMGRKTPPFGLV